MSRPAERIARSAILAGVVLTALTVCAPPADAVSAPIHIANTDGDGVLMRSSPHTSGQSVGWIPERASPDYNCFAWGQRVNNVPIWFSVNYNGATGYYASYYDDSTYSSNEELTAKYGIPQCGANPADVDDGRPGVAVYYSPYGAGSHELYDQSTKTVYAKEYANECTSSVPAFGSALRVAGGRPIRTLAGWSSGRVGVMSFLKRANERQLRRLQYVLLIDPGTYDEMTCDRDLAAGARLARWLLVNRSARLVVISGSDVSQIQRSKGIQETYFNAIRKQSRTTGVDLRSRVLTCNYPIGHQTAFRVGQYWIANRIGARTSSCPWLSESKQTFKPTAGWHP